jgi:hypothetical protein
MAPRRRAYKCLRADAGAARPRGVLRIYSSACSLRLRHDAASWRDHRTHSSIGWRPDTPHHRPRSRASNQIENPAAYSLPSCFFAAATTWSGSNPYFRCNSLSGAEAPNVCMPMT